MARPALLALVALLAAALAGCGAPGPSPPAAVGEPLPPLAIEQPAFELRGCEGAAAFFAFDDAAVEAEMPSGHRAYTVQGIAGALVGFTAMVCDVVVEGNVSQRVPIARTYVQVGPTTHYGFEWMFPVSRAPALAGWLSSHGWPVLDAEVILLPGLLTVRGADVDYVVADAGRTGQGPIPAGVSGALVHFVHGEPPVRLDENNTYDEAQSTTASVPALAASKGALARFTPAGADGASASGGLSFLGIRVDARFFVPPADEALEPVRT
jgi:hypothetical protein